MGKESWIAAVVDGDGKGGEQADGMAGEEQCDRTSINERCLFLEYNGAVSLYYEHEIQYMPRIRNLTIHKSLNILEKLEKRIADHIRHKIILDRV